MKKEKLQFFGKLFGVNMWIEPCDKYIKNKIDSFFAGKWFQFYGGKEVFSGNDKIKKIMIRMIRKS
jgi:hypothetical protein